VCDSVCNMASIKQRPGSPYWVCCYTKANGTRTQRSTKQGDKDNAWKVCLAFEDAEADARKRFLTQEQARKVISGIVKDATGERMRFCSAEQWLRDWVAEKGKTKSQGTFARYSSVVEGFIKHLGGFAALDVSALEPRHVRTFRDAEREAGKSPVSCNFAVKVISTGLNAAMCEGYLESNPAKAVATLPSACDEESGKSCFTDDQLTALLAAAPDTDWRGAMLLAYTTGARFTDVTNMRWTNVNLTAQPIRVSSVHLGKKPVILKPKAISFRPRKTARTGKLVVVPLHSQLEEHLMGIAGNDDAEGFLFPSLAGRPTGGARGLSPAFAAIMQKAGIKQASAQPRKGVGRTVNALTFHSFRHTNNSAMANAGVSQETRQAAVGHSSPAMNEIYTHRKMEALRAAVGAIPRIKGF